MKPIIQLKEIFLSGSPKEMGEQFAEACRKEIHELYRIRMHWAQDFALTYGRSWSESQILASAAKSLPASEAFDQDVWDEFCGIAKAADLKPEQLYAMQGLTDLRDLLAFGPLPDGMGCSSFIVPGSQSKKGKLLLGQSWDLQDDNMPFMRLVRRQPKDAPATTSLTLTGCLSLIGMNECGIAVGNTNIKSTDARHGVHYLFMIHKALSLRSADHLAATFIETERAGAHYYYCAGPDGSAFALECLASDHEVFHIENDSFVHCNHILSDKLKAQEAKQPMESSLYRQKRFTELLKASAGAIDVDTLKEILADKEGGDCCISRQASPAPISTNGCVIMSPETKEFHACRSRADEGEWKTVTF